MKSLTCEHHGASKRLAIFLHGFDETGTTMRPVVDALLETPFGMDCDVAAPSLPFGRLSRARPSVVLAELLLQLDAIWEQQARAGAAYEEVVFVGHSLGSLFARKLYLMAMGETARAPFEPDLREEVEQRQGSALSTPRAWGAATSRIVSLAGINRGWSISHHMSLLRGTTMSMGLWAGKIVRALGAEPFIVMACHRGAPFITQLRIQWLAQREVTAAKDRSLAHVVQLLGTQDDLVPPSDNIDPITGDDFTYLEVPKSGHATVVQMGAHHGDAGLARKQIFQSALSIARGGVAQTPLAVLAASKPNPAVTDVVFVMHGIRDLGYWTERIGLRVASLATTSYPSRKIALETSSYGYFPLLSFLRPGARQEKVEWLMDKVTQARAQYPNAVFHYVGHSHGTYLLAKAMKDYPAIAFQHVVLAGSVLRTDQDWHELLTRNRVSRVLNFVASADWVVAFFPNAMQKVQWQDVGGAGHYGFNAQVTGLEQLPAPDRFVRGGHSAALDEGWWNTIAEFVLTGNFKPAPMPLESRHARLVALGASVAPLIWLAIAVLLSFGMSGLLHWMVPEWIKTLAVFAYVSLIWMVLTRF